MTSCNGYTPECFLLLLNSPNRTGGNELFCSAVIRAVVCGNMSLVKCRFWCQKTSNFSVALQREEITQHLDYAQLFNVLCVKEQWNTAIEIYDSQNFKWEDVQKPFFYACQFGCLSLIERILKFFLLYVKY
jgi:hypothetical protein